MNRVINPGDEIGLLDAIFRASILNKSWTRRPGAVARKVDPIDSMLYEYMAEMIPDVGLDIWLGQFPKADTRLTTVYLRLFKSQSPSTVFAYNGVLADITETIYTSYAPQSLATATWGALASDTTVGRKTTYPQVSFPSVGATGDTINGFYITPDTGPPTKAFGQSNFDDGNAAVVLTGDVVKVTPTIQANH